MQNFDDQRGIHKPMVIIVANDSAKDIQATTHQASLFWLVSHLIILYHTKQIKRLINLIFIEFNYYQLKQNHLGFVW